MNNRELILLKQLAKCWNELDTIHLERYLSEYVIYESQYVLTPLLGKIEVLDYLDEKFLTIRNHMKTKLILINASIGYLPSMSMRSCIILSQIIEKEMNQSTVLIEIKDSLISRIDICFIPATKDVMFEGMEINLN
ncbi:MAG TPA: hypothetical protein PKA90_07155 [Ignavibacteria bacterium]|mgnify:CR=1 FL=1|nr:hypothetical protein [Ignavibacteria bacterium]HMR40194.1 hypothetical protein [Ignavibacteria bacterium]